MMPLVDRLTVRWFVKDLDLRASLIATTVEEPIRQLVAFDDRAGLRDFFSRLTQDERLYAVGYCSNGDVRPEGTPTLPSGIRCDSLAAYLKPSGHIISEAHGPLLVSARPMRIAADSGSAIVLVHDMSFVGAAQRGDASATCSTSSSGSAPLISLITVVVAQLSWRGWVHGMRALLRGEGLLRPSSRIDGAGDSAARRRPPHADPRSRGRASAARRRASGVDAGDAARDPRSRAARRGGDRRLQPRAVHPRARRRRHRGAAAGERPGHGARADHARLLGHLDRARQRLGRPRGGRRARSRRRAARGSRRISCAASGSRRRRRPATTTASPTRASGRSATSRTCGRPSARATGSSTSG